MLDLPKLLGPHSKISSAFVLIFFSRTLIIQMVVPNAYCGRVIGKAGSKINSITV